MTLVLLAGMAVGLGVGVIVLGLRPAPEPLSAALSRINKQADAPAPVKDAGLVDRDTRVGRWLITAVPPLARVIDGMRADLRVVGVPPEDLSVRIGSYVAAGLLGGVWIGVFTSLIGIGIPLALPGTISLVGILWGVLAPIASIRRRAAARRVVFLYALSSWCDVVVMTLAAGRGVEQAMETGANAGQGWAFAELRGALASGYVKGETPWAALAQLGRDLKIKDMEELASTVSLAGEEGAAVRETLAAKSRTIRERRTAEAEQNAASATEKMGLPAVLMVFGVMIFLGFPMVMRLLQGDL